MAHEVTLIPGDGVGPELDEATKFCIEATGVEIKWEIEEAGVDIMAKVGTPVPDSVIESCRRTKVALKAPITTPVGTGFRSVNVYLRQALDPIALHRGLQSQRMRCILHMCPMHRWPTRAAPH